MNRLLCSHQWVIRQRSGRVLWVLVTVMLVSFAAFVTRFCTAADQFRLAGTRTGSKVNQRKCRKNIDYNLLNYNKLLFCKFISIKYRLQFIGLEFTAQSILFILYFYKYKIINTVFYALVFPLHFAVHYF